MSESGDYHVGFQDEIIEGCPVGNHVKYIIKHVCRSDNGKVVAWVLPEYADKVAEALCNE